MLKYLAVILFAGAASTQQYEIEATVGYGVYQGMPGVPLKVATLA